MQSRNAASNRPTDPTTALSTFELQAQMEVLKAALAEREKEAAKAKAKTGSKVLVGGSPSPRKNRMVDVLGVGGSKRPREEDDMPAPRLKPPRISSLGTKALPADRQALLNPAEPAESTFLSSLTTSRHHSKVSDKARAAPKSKAFTETVSRPAFGSSRTKASSKTAEPVPPTRDYAAETYSQPAPRNDDLTVTTRLPVGPIHHPPVPQDPKFNSIEPNSQTRLSSRVLEHSQLQAYLSDRYICKPAELYGVVKKGKGGEWEVPVVGDWVVIGVLGEKGGIKITQGSRGNEDDDAEEEDETGLIAGAEGDEDEGNGKGKGKAKAKGKGKAKPKKEEHTKSTKRYITFKLLDMSSPVHTGSSILNLTLFEANSTSSDTLDDSGLRTKTYSGGSGGAYELLWKEQGGAVIALLNPRILRSRTPEGTGEILTLTPESAESVVVIGRSRDLGSCTALRRDTGKECGGWCDLRAHGGVGVCEFHVKKQVGKVRAGRAELFIGTGGMQTHTGAKFGSKTFTKKPTFDAATKTGLLPRAHGNPALPQSINGQKTYILAGSSASASRVAKPNRWEQARDEDRLEGQKRKRKREQEEREVKESLKALEGKGGLSVGGRYLEDAEARRREIKAREAAKAKGKKDEAKTSAKGKGKQKETPSSEEDVPVPEEDAKPLPRPFPPAALRAIGFDPTHSGGTLFSRPAPSNQEDHERERRREAAVELLGARGDRVAKIGKLGGAKFGARGTAVRIMKGGKGSNGWEKTGEGGKTVSVAVEKEAPMAVEKGVPSQPAKAAEARGEILFSDEEEDDLVVEPKRHTPRQGRERVSYSGGEEDVDQAEA